MAKGQIMQEFQASVVELGLEVAMTEDRVRIAGLARHIVR
jgi:hypothetical protein